MTDKQIMQIVRGFTKGILGKDCNESKCFMVSAPLASYLHLLGVDCDLIRGKVEGDKYHWGHYWIKLKDGRIIDPTASQLNCDPKINMPKIYIGEKPSFYQEINNPL